MTPSALAAPRDIDLDYDPPFVTTITPTEPHRYVTVFQHAFFVDADEPIYGYVAVYLFIDERHKITYVKYRWKGCGEYRIDKRTVRYMKHARVM